MTDNEIIKALECCSKSSKIGDCIDNKCTMLGEYGCSGWMNNKLIKTALDLINRQKAKIERLRGIIDRHYGLFEEMGEAHPNEFEKAKLVAITEFAERVKTELEDSKYATVDDSYRRTCNSVVDYCIKKVDQIAKEMKEGVTDTNVGCKDKGEQ